MAEKRTGKVLLVGAGPGDPRLITWRGLEALASADAVCYDALVDPTLIATLPPSVERHYVGKRAGGHSMPQDEINALLVRLAREGKVVVRLKGGDPFIFGRGGEEALALREAEVPFEVVPGVTAASAATACAGIPLTHRGASAFALLFTAHETPGKPAGEAEVPHDLLARAGEGTLVGYMGVRRLNELVKSLLDNGMDPSTPAALIERGSTPRQKQVSAALAELPRAAEEEGIQPPALFVAGRVVRLAGVLSWKGAGPLGGRRILVTRPCDVAGEIYDLLAREGAEVVPAPAILTEAREDPEGWARLREVLPAGGWLIFTSEAGVRFFFARFRRIARDLRALAAMRIAVLGRGTASALAERGLAADFQPSESLTKVLARELASRVRPGEWAVRVRGDLADETVEDALARSGAEVLPLAVYRTRTAPLDEGVRAWVAAGPIEAVTFTSGSTVRGFFEQWGEKGARELLADAAVASIGPVTSAALGERGVEVDVEAERHDVPGIVTALVKHLLEREHPEP